MKNLLLHVALFVVSLMLAPGVGWGQGWERVYDFGNDEVGRRVVETQNNQFVVAATQNEFVGTDKAVSLSRMDGEGQLIWSKVYPVPGIYDIVFLHEQVDGSLILLTVENDSAITKQQSVFWAFSGSGDVLEKKVLDLPGTDESWVFKVDLMQDTLVMIGAWDLNDRTNPFLCKVSLSGDLVWHRRNAPAFASISGRCRGVALTRSDSKQWPNQRRLMSSKCHGAPISRPEWRLSGAWARSRFCF